MRRRLPTGPGELIAVFKSSRVLANFSIDCQPFLAKKKKFARSDFFVWRLKELFLAKISRYRWNLNRFRIFEISVKNHQRKLEGWWWRLKWSTTWLGILRPGFDSCLEKRFATSLLFGQSKILVPWSKMRLKCNLAPSDDRWQLWHQICPFVFSMEIKKLTGKNNLAAN